MHTIDDCPICGKTFMYHTTDKHLYRLKPTNKGDKEYVVCQDCDTKQQMEYEAAALEEYLDTQRDAASWLKGNIG